MSGRRRSETRSEEAGKSAAADCCGLLNDPWRRYALATRYEHLEVNSRF